MRARYYSPAMRRFVNADILHGSISDSTSLNRYSYVNGNPVSFVDPFGLSKDTGRGYSIANIDSLLNVIKSVKGSDTELATVFLAATLDMLLGFKYLFEFKHIFNYLFETEYKFESSFPLGINTSATFSVSASRGIGPIKISSIVSEQFELLGSLSFEKNNVTIDLSDGGEISIQYSANVSEYTSMAAYFSANLAAGTMSAGYTAMTTDNSNKSISTTIEMTHWENINNQNKAPTTVPVSVPTPSLSPSPSPVPVPEKEKSIDLWKAWWYIGIAVVATVIATGAIAETVVTSGAGIWNDGIAVGNATAAWTKAAQSISAIGQQIYSSGLDFLYWLTKSPVRAG